MNAVAAEQGRAGHNAAAADDDAGEVVVLYRKADDGFVDDADGAGYDLFALGCGEDGAVGEEDDVVGPLPLSNWVKQCRIDRGEIPGISTAESAELRAARRRIRELETELLIIRQAAKFLGEERPRPKGSSR